MKSILVIGGTGTVGRQVVGQLVDAGERVRALVRKADIARLPSEVEIFSGDLTRPETLDAGVLEGVDAVFLVWTAPAETVGRVLERLVRHAPRIVFLSSPYKTQHPFFQAAQPNPLSALHAQIEGIIEKSGRECAFVRPGMFAANWLHMWAPRIRAGADAIRWPYADAMTAPVDERDIAAVAVRALCDDGHASQEYLVTGPESLSQAEQLAIIGEVVGRPLRFEELSPEQAMVELPGGLPPPVMQMLLRAWSGAVGQPALVTQTVEPVTGKPARTFREWASEHAAEFGRIGRS